MNDIQLVKTLLKEGESNKLEFKSTLNKEAIGKVMASFLNTMGGQLLIGVQENGEINGVEKAEQNSLMLRNYLVHSIVPEASIYVDVLNVNDDKIILCKVSEGSKQPYIFNGTIFFRREAQTIKATSAQVSTLITQRQEDELHWERQIKLGIDWEDLDEKLIVKTFTDSVIKNRSSYKGNDVGSFLVEYGLMFNMTFTNACGLLFAKKVARFYPQSRVRLTEYPESKISDNLIRDEFLEGNLFTLLDRLQKFVDGLGTRSIFLENDWQRKDFSFPPFALREGFINALIHRDYSNYNSHMTVSVFPDRLVIANSGSLPEELGGVGSLKREHRSFPNNPDIAHLFFLRGYIDKLGRGTNKIADECKKAGLKAPQWKSTKSEVTLTFFGPEIKIDALKAKSDALNKLQNDALKAVIDTLNEDVSKTAAGRYYDVLRLLYSIDSAPLSTVMSSLSVSRATAQRYLLSLIEQELVTPIGPDKKRQYSINDALKAKLDALN